MKFCEEHLRAYPEDHTECSICNIERLEREKQQAKATKPKAVYEIPKQSEKKKEREKKLAKVRQKAKKEFTSCQSCDNPEGPLDYSHTLSVKQYPQYEDDPDNGVIECRKCHHIWENRPLAEKMKLKTFRSRVAYIMRTEPRHWNKMQPKLTPLKA